MVDLATAQDVCWKVSLFLRVFLLGLLFFRRRVRAFPFFTAYLAINIAKALFSIFAVRGWGPTSVIYFDVVWGSEALVTCARALAVMELCRLLLAGYRGIWSLAWRILAACGAFVLLYSSLVSDHRWKMAVLGANRALELTIATVIVALFVFMRHYRVAPEPTVRLLAMGFFIYSCVEVINYTVLERWLVSYLHVWSALGVFTYLVCVLLWIWALRKSTPQPIAGPTLLPGSIYDQVSPEINSRLRELNEKLSKFWKRRL
jgi:hypothetical protein